MSRRWLGLALLLSVGVNAGILATLAVERLRDGAGATTPAEGEGPGAVEPPDGVEADGGPGTELSPDAEEPPGRPSEPPAVPPEVGRRLDVLADRLGLAGEDRRRFLEIQQRFFRETFRHRQEVFARQRALRQELVAPEPDRARVAEALDRLTAARTSLERSFVETVLESRELLDPAQEGEYLRFVARLRAPGEGGRRGGPPRGPGDRFRRP